MGTSGTLPISITDNGGLQGTDRHVRMSLFVGCSRVLASADLPISVTGIVPDFPRRTVEVRKWKRL